MTCTIAVAGKGGTGKTTFAALVIKYLSENNLGSILAIDADPSSNLNLVLGMELYDTIGDIREETLSQVSSGTFDRSISKQDYLEYRINECLVEGEGVDLLAMGRPEGPGCYCAANNILRLVIDRLGNSYDFVVIDNEAGMEHISRQTTRHIDILFVLSDPTVRGLAAAKHIVALIEELRTRVGRAYLVINRVDGELPPPIRQRVEELGLDLIGSLPNDPQVVEFDVVGRPLVELNGDSPIYQAVKEIIREVRLKG